MVRKLLIQFKKNLLLQWQREIDLNDINSLSLCSFFNGHCLFVALHSRLASYI